MAESRVEALSLASGERHVVVENAIEARYLRGGTSRSCGTRR